MGIATETKRLSPKERLFRIILWSVLEAFALGTLIFVLVQGELTQILMCVFTLGLLCLPFVATKLFRCELNGAFFAFCLTYAVSPMLGHIYKLYYLTGWWDDLLHASGGVVFAVFGVFLAKLLSKGAPSFWLTALFALFFSIAIAGLWEFIEYGCDQIFHTDMQNDSVVRDIYSYLLSNETGAAGQITDIGEVFIHGKPLGVGGYLDIGLRDTMSDMLFETLGAVVFFVVYIVDKDRHSLIYSPACIA